MYIHLEVSALPLYTSQLSLAVLVKMGNKGVSSIRFPQIAKDKLGAPGGTECYP